MKWGEEDFSGGPVDKNPPANAGTGFNPCSGKILHPEEQLSPRATTTEACVPRAYALQWRITPAHHN